MAKTKKQKHNMASTQTLRESRKRQHHGILYFCLPPAPSLIPYFPSHSRLTWCASQARRSLQTLMPLRLPRDVLDPDPQFQVTTATFPLLASPPLRSHLDASLISFSLKYLSFPMQAFRAFGALLSVPFLFILIKHPDRCSSISCPSLLACLLVV